VGRVKSPFLIKTFDIVPSCRIEDKSIIGKNSVANSIQKRYNEGRVELKMNVVPRKNVLISKTVVINYSHKRVLVFVWYSFTYSNDILIEIFE